MQTIFRFCALFAGLWLALIASPAHADDVGAAGRGVVRVVTVAIVNGEVVGFGHGSGFAVSPTRIVTNAHVVRSAVEYPQNVALGVVPSEGKQSYEARLIAVDTAKDLALIEIVKGRLSPVSLYTGPFDPGTDVIALGYPGNVDLATAKSAQDYITPRAPTRSDGNFSNFQAINGVSALVHTANIARGNSGGPLVDDCGRVIGVNTFITRADDGDATFAFAISNRELTQFLAKAQQSYANAATACISMAEVAAKDRERLQAEASAKAKAEAAEAAKIASERESALAKARAANTTARENRIAIAIILFVAGALMAGYAGLLYSQKATGVPLDSRFKIIAGLAGGLIAVAAIAFITRPSADVTLPPTGTFGPVDPMPAVDAATPAKAVNAVSTPAAANLSCAFKPDQSRITVSTPTAVDFDFAAGGCVNGRTQYAPLPDGNWQRIMISDSEDTVTVATYSPAAQSYRTDRYLLGSDAMGKIRALKKANGDRACSADTAYLQKLSIQLEALRSTLPAQANERLVYGCGVK